MTDTPKIEPSEAETPWYLAQIKPNCYAIAERNLARQGFAVFSPTREETRKRGGKFVASVQPLFPGYLFVGFDPEIAPWRAINSTYGVSNLVTLGGNMPRPVPAGLVQELVGRCNETGQLLPPSSLQPGDEVRVTNGPFTDFVTTVDKVSADQRVWVLLDIMGRSTKVAMLNDDLQKA